ncbi:MAG TPA: chalcone isomerase family protein [Gammaproteobacteria bacterium]|nr:chalcone isomerase family protein [Gammaproteobacteria bacterium]
MKKMLLAAVFVTFAGGAGAAELAGVSLPDTVEVAGQELVLNGIGLREKAWIDVYVGGLYVPEASDKAADLIEANGPSRMVMHFVRDVPVDKVVEAWNDGFKNNNSKELNEAIAERAEQFNAFFTEDLAKDDVITIDYIPDEGTKVFVNSDLKGTIPGHDFATAVRAIWLGPKPPTKKFQQGLLGKR